MADRNVLIYYSTNTSIANYLAKSFYNGIHFVWCSPVFNPETLNSYDEFNKIPRISSPYHIYHNLHKEVVGNDLHSILIEKNKDGLHRGALHHLEIGTITNEEYARIIKMIDMSPITDYKPLLYIIPATPILAKIKRVEVEASANPLSVEYQILNLTSDEFDIIELRN